MQNFLTFKIKKKYYHYYSYDKRKCFIYKFRKKNDINLVRTNPVIYQLK